MRIGFQEVLIILAIVALLFGPKRLGSLGNALKKGVQDFMAEATGKGQK